MAEKPSMVDKVPTQIDEQELKAEMNVEIPEAMDIEETPENVEIVEEEDGSVVVDFDPKDDKDMDGDFYANLAEDMSDDELGRLSGELTSEFEENKSSRQEWEDAFANGLELLGFSYEERSQPFRGASGVTHPLLAESATQFQAQAFNELLPPGGPVRTLVMGSSTPEKEDQAQRVKEFMNYYVTSVMEEYTPEFDQMLFYLPLAGSTFKKVYYDENLDRAVSKFIPAEDLVVPYSTSDLETCPNITHVVKMSLNDLRKRQLSGFYRDIPVIPAQGDSSSVKEELERIDGMYPSNVDYDCTLLECHVDLDLEGFEEEDEEGEATGIRIPYVVTISQDNGQILSIRRNYKEDDEKKKKIQYFVHYKFLPGFGFYGLGLIHTIGGLSRTATAALRQLIDAGTLSNLPAGFKARGLRIRDDDEPLQPGEFRDVDAPGGDIKASLMSLPFKGPDQTLMALLGFVVDAGRRFATITDMKVGDGNQQAAVGTTIAMLEQGSRVMSAVHKRLHYAMKLEFKLLASVMSEFLPDSYPYTIAGVDSSVKSEDFDERVDVLPVSNPNIFSQAQRIALAQTKMQMATSAPDMHNMYEVFRDMYEALGVRDIDRILKRTPEPEPEPKDPASENIDTLDMMPLIAFEGQDHEAHIMSHMVFGSTPIVAQQPQMAVALQKHIMDHVRISAREKAAVAMLQSSGGQALSEEQMLDVEAKTAQFVAEGMTALKQLSAQLSGQGPDPLVQLKEKELQVRAQAEQNDAQIDKAKLGLEQQKVQQRDEQFDKRLDSQERQTAARINAAERREMMKQQKGGQ
tara:strand:- start:3795 stop:6200 length:2406 start_codon:yes stop_codon:yes gene_type:complete